MGQCYCAVSFCLIIPIRHPSVGILFEMIVCKLKHQVIRNAGCCVVFDGCAL